MSLRKSFLARVMVVALITMPATAARAQFTSAMPRRTLTPFRSDRDIERFLRKLADQREIALGHKCSGGGVTVATVAAQAGAADQRTIIRGSIASAAGRALDQANVAIRSLSLSVPTAPDGRFQIVIPAGKLAKKETLQVVGRRIGFNQRVATFEVGPGDSVLVDFVLCQDTLQLSEVVLTAAAPGVADAITNVQHAGVDEGDIVKLSGGYLVVLRRGRLFTIAVNDDKLQPVAASDAFGPGIDPAGAWYDELLLYRDKVVVVGYSYARGGTEIGVFRLGPSGTLAHLGTYHLRSNDYYSARNYASRLVGSKLVFYTPLNLAIRADDPLASLPAMRKWRGTATASEFQRIATTSHIYQPPMELEPRDVALHTVTSCDLDADELRCEATALFGPSGRVFYVSPKAVYVWASSWSTMPGRNGERPPSLVYRMPLDGSTPTALGVAGSPVDQFSFLESDDGFLNVLVRSEGKGDAMWRSERAEGGAALLRVSLESFGDGTTAAPRESYRALPTPQGSSFQNRFVGDVLLYGIGNGWGRPTSQQTTLFG
ncbi:MAG: beta-propeller domain-containing protein, partial [bacterium]